LALLQREFDKDRSKHIPFFQGKSLPTELYLSPSGLGRSCLPTVFATVRRFVLRGLAWMKRFPYAHLRVAKSYG
jgi:hypothetical protein